MRSALPIPSLPSAFDAATARPLLGLTHHQPTVLPKLRMRFSVCDRSHESPQALSRSGIALLPHGRCSVGLPFLCGGDPRQSP